MNDAKEEVRCELCSPSSDLPVYHYGKCPRVKSIEYFDGGQIKRVEFSHDSEPELFTVAQLCQLFAK